MRRILILLACVALIGLGYYLARTHDAGQAGPGRDGTVQIPRPHPEGNDWKLQTTPEKLPPGKEPLEGALTTLFATSKEDASAFPKGTRLLSVKLQNGLATVDVSSEFNGVKRSGSTGESLAQEALRKTLAQFPNVEKMQVLVEGKPFEGEHADWSEAIPVRDTHAGVEGRP